MKKQMESDNLIDRNHEDNNQTNQCQDKQNQQYETKENNPYDIEPHSQYDIIIIGAGIIGTTIAYELSKYPLRILVIEKENDVANGATIANSAIVHAGYDPIPGTLKAILNVQGSQMMKDYCKTLDVLYEPKPSLVVAFQEAEMDHVHMLFERGQANEVPDLHILNQAQLRAIEPNISEEAVGCLYAGSSAIFEPWGLAIAAMEVAMENGTHLKLNTDITRIEKRQTHEGDTTTHHYWMEAIENSPKQTSIIHLQARTIINCAGIDGDKIHNLCNPPAFTIRPRKGHYYVLDEPALSVVNNIMFPCPNEKGKGILILPAIHQKILIGPDSEFIDDKYDLGCEASQLQLIKQAVRSYVKELPYEYTIRSFAGNRPTSDQSDYIIKEVQDGFFDVAGIESPGLSSSPAIAKYVEEMVITSQFDCEPKDSYLTHRRPVVRFKSQPPARQQQLLKSNPKYGTIICRCEKVSEAEIVDAIHRPCGATTVKAVKKRVGCGLGRCQGGFCEARIISILASEQNIRKQDVLYDSLGSYILLGENKQEEVQHA